MEGVIGLRELRQKMDACIARIQRGEKIFVKRKSKTVFLMAPPNHEYDWRRLQQNTHIFDYFLRQFKTRIGQNNLGMCTIAQNTRDKTIFRIRRGSKQITVKIIALEEIDFSKQSE